MNVLKLCLEAADQLRGSSVLESAYQAILSIPVILSAARVTAGASAVVSLSSRRACVAEGKDPQDLSLTTLHQGVLTIGSVFLPLLTFIALLRVSVPPWWMSEVFS